MQEKMISFVNLGDDFFDIGLPTKPNITYSSEYRLLDVSLEWKCAEWYIRSVV